MQIDGLAFISGQVNLQSQKSDWHFGTGFGTRTRKAVRTCAKIVAVVFGEQGFGTPDALNQKGSDSVPSPETYPFETREAECPELLRGKIRSRPGNVCLK